jgi:type I restriction-modification system DNA methylase subunit
MSNSLKTQESLFILADNLVLSTKKLLYNAKTEEDLRIGFEKLLEPIMIKLNIKSNPRYEKSVYKGRSDAVHCQVVIEYEKPLSFSSKKNIDHAYEQLIDYLFGESKESNLTKLVGVGFDGEQIFFVQYQGSDNRIIDKSKFVIRGPYEFNSDSARTFLIHLRALARIPMSAINIADKFGPESEIAPKLVSAFSNSLKHWRSHDDQERIQTYFNEWKRLFGIVYGEQFINQKNKKNDNLASLYKIGKEIDFQELLFSVHTYFAFLMKLIAAELLTVQDRDLSSSLASDLAHISEDELKLKLKDIEDGGVYARKGITNFIEGDFFRWYLDAWSPRLKEAIQETARIFSEFEPATSTLDPNSTKDLLKKIYQYLVPQEVRHILGEYYTPDWLAEILLDEVGYDGDTLKRFLDPACGSGSFLVLAIQRAKEHGAKEKWHPREIAKRIVANIWGFDLNPLAVIAARTNYLFALGDLINELDNIEIPIYLSDSVLSPISTGKFDYVVGNPPWIRWDYLSSEYRNKTLSLWKKYGLFSLKGFQTRLGGGKKDLSMLFVYSCADYYLKDGSVLGFLITQEVFKSKGAGEGFRRFQLGNDEYLKVLKAHDFTSLKPFKGASNKTALIIIKKGEKTEYPIPYILWEKIKGTGNIDDKSLNEVAPLLLMNQILAKPIFSQVGAWQNFEKKTENIEIIEGDNNYKAILGANPNPYGVFWLEVKNVLSDGTILIRNMPQKGKLKIESVEKKIESDLVYPAIRGSDIHRWQAIPNIYILVVQEPINKTGYPEAFLKSNYPLTYEYLFQFRYLLLNRPLYIKFHKESSAPFYSQFNISKETFIKFKVVWKAMSNDIFASVITSFKTDFGFKTCVPMHTTSFFNVDDEIKAHYLCAIVNSNSVRDFIKSFSSAGRGFGTPSVMKHVGIPKFDHENELHQKLAQISKKCHYLKCEEKGNEIEELERENDKLVKVLFDLRSG